MRKMENLNELILRAQNGDSEAELQVLKSYNKLVKSIAFSYYVACADRDNEDLVQEGMVALLRAIKTYNLQGEASFETYASRCIHNAIIDELRKAPEPSLPITEDVEAPTETMLVELAEAIASILTPTERRVLELKLSAMSYAEIAKELGIEKKKVDNLIMSAKKKLKEALEG